MRRVSNEAAGHEYLSFLQIINHFQTIRKYNERLDLISPKKGVKAMPQNDRSKTDRFFPILDSCKCTYINSVWPSVLFSLFDDSTITERSSFQTDQGSKSFRFCWSYQRLYFTLAQHSVFTMRDCWPAIISDSWNRLVAVQHDILMSGVFQPLYQRAPDAL